MLMSRSDRTLRSKFQASALDSQNINVTTETRRLSGTRTSFLLLGIRTNASWVDPICGDFSWPIPEGSHQLDVPGPPIRRRRWQVLFGVGLQELMAASFGLGVRVHGEVDGSFEYFYFASHGFAIELHERRVPSELS